MATAETLATGAPAPQRAQQPPKPGARPSKPQDPPQPDEAGEEGTADAPALQWFRVLKDTEVPSQSGRYILKKGKVLSNKGYDMQTLRDAGVELEPAEEPAWHKRLQATGKSLAR